MSTRIEPSCSNCYFQLSGLCALPGDTVCPTFRATGSGSPSSSRHAQLVLRPIATPTTQAA